MIYILYYVRDMTTHDVSKCLIAKHKLKIYFVVRMEKEKCYTLTKRI